MLSLPPHTTHKTQPLYRAFFKPLQTFYNQAVERWLLKHPGCSITSYQIAKLFGEATMKIAIKGFESSGIWPCSRNTSSHHLFHRSMWSQVAKANQFLIQPHNEHQFLIQANNDHQFLIQPHNDHQFLIQPHNDHQILT